MNMVGKMKRFHGGKLSWEKNKIIRLKSSQDNYR